MTAPEFYLFFKFNHLNILFEKFNTLFFNLIYSPQNWTIMKCYEHNKINNTTIYSLCLSADHSAQLRDYYTIDYYINSYDWLQYQMIDYSIIWLL